MQVCRLILFYILQSSLNLAPRPETKTGLFLVKWKSFAVGDHKFNFKANKFDYCIGPHTLSTCVAECIMQINHSSVECSSATERERVSERDNTMCGAFHADKKTFFLCV